MTGDSRDASPGICCFTSGLTLCVSVRSPLKNFLNVNFFTQYKNLENMTSHQGENNNDPDFQHAEMITVHILVYLQSVLLPLMCTSIIFTVKINKPGTVSATRR